MGYAGNIAQRTKCDTQHTRAHGKRQGAGTTLAISHGSSEIIDLLPGSVTNQLLLPEVGCGVLGTPPQQALLDMTLWLQLQLCLAVIGYAGYPLSRYTDIIAKKTGLSASLIGFMLLATVTSLPELVTGISAVTAADAPNIAVSDILGSAIFNLAILVVLNALYRRETIYSRAAQGHILSAALGALLIAFAGSSLLLDRAGMSPALGHVGLYPPFVVLIYFVAVHVIYQYERCTLTEYTATTAGRYPEVTLRRAITGFTLVAAAIVAVGSWLPFIAKDIAELMGWGQNFVGILLVVVTSAPEIAVTLSALRIGAIDMAIANLLGSNLLNIIILAVDDLFYAKDPLLAHVNSSHAFTAFTAVTMNAMVIVALVFRPQGRAMLGLIWVSQGLFLLYILNTWILFEHEY